MVIEPTTDARLTIEEMNDFLDHLGNARGVLESAVLRINALRGHEDERHVRRLLEHERAARHRFDSLRAWGRTS